MYTKQKHSKPKNARTSTRLYFLRNSARVTLAKQHAKQGSMVYLIVCVCVCACVCVCVFKDKVKQCVCFVSSQFQ